MGGWGEFGERGQGLVCGKRKWLVARRGWAVARVGCALIKCLLGPAAINSTARDDEGSSPGRSLGAFINLVYGLFWGGLHTEEEFLDEGIS
jgi:hypothetical protein